MKLHRSPAPKRIASSISETVATPSFTSHSASRHSASSKPVGDEAVDLLAHDERPHPERPVDVDGAIDGGGRRRRAADDLDERQEVDRVERMTDDEPFRVRHVALQLGRQQARRRGTEHDRRAGRPAGVGEHRLLEGEPLGGALLHEVGAGDRFVGRADEAQRALGRTRHVGQAVVGPPGVVEHLADLARRVRIGVVEVDVDAVEHEPGRPPTADHATAEQPDPVEPGDRRPHVRFTSLSSSRTSSGRFTRTFIPSRICTARATSSALVAS